MTRFFNWLFDAVPKVPDHIEPDYCFRCEMLVEAGRNVHRPCFKVSCYCHCSRVAGYIA